MPETCCLPCICEVGLIPVLEETEEWVHWPQRFFCPLIFLHTSIQVYILYYIICIYNIYLCVILMLQGKLRNSICYNMTTSCPRSDKCLNSLSPRMKLPELAQHSFTYLIKSAKTGQLHQGCLRSVHSNVLNELSFDTTPTNPPESSNHPVSETSPSTSQDVATRRISL